MTFNNPDAAIAEALAAFTAKTEATPLMQERMQKGLRSAVQKSISKWHGGEHSDVGIVLDLPYKITASEGKIRIEYIELLVQT